MRCAMRARDKDGLLEAAVCLDGGGIVGQSFLFL